MAGRSRKRKFDLKMEKEITGPCRDDGAVLQAAVRRQIMAIRFLILLGLSIGLLLGDHAYAQSNLPPCKENYFTACFGTYTLPNGSKYVGEFRDGKRNGQGTFTIPNGEKYVGEFRDGKQNGQGTYTYPDGAKYVGEFRDGKYNGNGAEYSPNGSTIRRGYWIDDTYVGSTPPPGYKPSGNRVALVQRGGVYTVPVLINDVIPLHFVVDSGASDVTIPADVVGTLIRMGKITDKDFVGEQKYRLADGSIITSKTFIIRSLKVGDVTVTNVLGSVADVKGSLLLGQSFLKKFKTWSIDNTKHELIFDVN